MSQRSLDQLTEAEDPAWPLIGRWVADARQAVEVLPAEREQAETTLVALQVTTRSPLGALALETGGQVSATLDALLSPAAMQFVIARHCGPLPQDNDRVLSRLRRADF